MRRSFLYGTIIALIGWIVLWGIVFGLDPIPTKVNSNVRLAFKATCKVMSGEMTGTGVLLNTGYIITASHVLDINGNDKIDDDEVDVTVKFYYDNFEVAAEIIFIGKRGSYDFAIIEPDWPMKSNIYVSEILPQYGDKVFTIGMTRGQGPLITEGFHSWKAMKNTSRASLFVHSGNSGGGIFNEQQSLCGIVSQAISAREIAPVRVYVPMPNGKDSKGNNQYKIIEAFGDARFLDHIAAWCEYVDAKTIRSVLRDRHLLFLIETQPETVMINSAYLHLIFQLIGVLACVTWFRRELFS